MDFVFLTLLLGNDYLPKLRGASLPRLWSFYKGLRRGPFASTPLLDASGQLSAVFLTALLKPLESTCTTSFSSADLAPRNSCPLPGRPEGAGVRRGRLRERRLQFGGGG